MNSIPSKTTVTLVNEEVTLTNGHIFVPMPVKNPSDALRASLLMLFKHVSDIHVSIVEIIADKFHLNVDDIHNAIKEDPRWTDMLTNPLIHDLTAAATENAAPAAAAPVAPVAKQTKTKGKTKLPTLTPEEKAANKAATKAQNKANRQAKKQTKQTQQTTQQTTQAEEEELVF